MHSVHCTDNKSTSCRTCTGTPSRFKTIAITSLLQNPIIPKEEFCLNQVLNVLGIISSKKGNKVKRATNQDLKSQHRPAPVQCSAVHQLLAGGNLRWQLRLQRRWQLANFDCRLPVSATWSRLARTTVKDNVDKLNSSKLQSVLKFADGQKDLRNTHEKQAFCKVGLQTGLDCIPSKFGFWQLEKLKSTFCPLIQDIGGV